MTDFPTAHHVALTVTNLEVSRRWYERLLGMGPALDEDVPALPGHHHGFRHVVFALPGKFVLALHKHDATNRDRHFDEFCPGLDHMSFGCADRRELERWQERLDELGIAHGGIAQDSQGFGLSFRDPDNIAIEFWAPRS